MPLLSSSISHSVVYDNPTLGLSATLNPRGRLCGKPSIVLLHAAERKSSHCIICIGQYDWRNNEISKGELYRLYWLSKQTEKRFLSMSYLLTTNWPLFYLKR